MKKGGAFLNRQPKQLLCLHWIDLKQGKMFNERFQRCFRQPLFCASTSPPVVFDSPNFSKERVERVGFREDPSRSAFNRFLKYRITA